VFGGERSKLEGQQKPKALQKKPFIFPDETLKKWLVEMNIDLSKRKTNMFTVLRRMLLQNAPSEKEFRMLEIVLQQSIRKMRSVKEKAIDKPKVSVKKKVKAKSKVKSKPKKKS
jgi:tRNA/rRNA methyltransferase